MLTCDRGHVEPILWLLQYCNDVKITHKTFNKICDSVHLPIAKWLYKYGYYKNLTLFFITLYFRYFQMCI